MILGIISDLGPWSWVLLGIILLGLEVLLPGVFLMFFGLAALVVGAVSVLFGEGASWWSWQAQIIAFCILSLLSAVIGKNIWSSKNSVTDSPNLNDRGSALIGKSAFVVDPIENGTGRIKLGDTVWKVTGPDMPAGTKVEVVGSQSNTLEVVKSPAQ
ncbi:MAG: NfeD family protein [Rhizobiaceae bacterium]